MPKLGFGKYGDYDISDVPEDYLEWLITSSKERIKQCESELARRDNAAMANMNWMQKIIKAGFNDLARKHHPDMGGTTQDMQELNASYDALKRAAEGR